MAAPRAWGTEAAEAPFPHECAGHACQGPVGAQQPVPPPTIPEVTVNRGPPPPVPHLPLVQIKVIASQVKVIHFLNRYYLCQCQSLPSTG